MNQQIKTIRQVHEELKQSATNLGNVLKEIGVKPLKPNEDFQSKKVTVDDIIRSIPSEEQLTISLNSQEYTQDKHNKVLSYAGNYQLIKKAGDKFNSLKTQQKNIYYLAAILNLPQIPLEYKTPQTHNLLPLFSYSLSLEKKAKIKYMEKNTLVEKYSLKQEENKVIDLAEDSEILHDDDILITVSFYDSHNGRKQHQFLCLQNQKLSELSHSFYCMIGQLEKSKQNNFFVIGENIYYHGNKTQIQSMAAKALIQDKIKYYLYQTKKTTLNDLRVVFGEPYLWRHLGGCDHMIVFKEARLVREDNAFNDVLLRRKYPLICFESKMKKRKCQGCGQKFANVALLSDPLKKGDSAYFCTKCHKNLHHHSTKVIPYIHQ